MLDYARKHQVYTPGMHMDRPCYFSPNPDLTHAIDSSILASVYEKGFKREKVASVADFRVESEAAR